MSALIARLVDCSGIVADLIFLVFHQQSLTPVGKHPAENFRFDEFFPRVTQATESEKGQLIHCPRQIEPPTVTPDLNRQLTFLA
jgi:hypothetical protein